MKFARLGPVGAEVPVVVGDDGARSLAGLTDDIDAAFLAVGRPRPRRGSARGRRPAGASRPPAAGGSAPRSPGRAR